MARSSYTARNLARQPRRQVRQGTGADTVNHTRTEPPRSGAKAAGRGRGSAAEVEAEDQQPSNSREDLGAAVLANVCQLYAEEATPYATLLQWRLYRRQGTRASVAAIHAAATEREELTFRETEAASTAPGGKRRSFAVLLAQAPPGFSGFADESEEPIPKQQLVEAAVCLLYGGWEPSLDPRQDKYQIVDWLREKKSVMVFGVLSFGRVLRVVRHFVNGTQQVLGKRDGHLVPYPHSEEHEKRQNALSFMPTGVRPDETYVKTWAQLTELLKTLLESNGGKVAVSDLKRAFRQNFSTELSETALGCTSLFELLLDKRCSSIIALERQVGSVDSIVLRSEQPVYDDAEEAPDAQKQSSRQEEVQSPPKQQRPRGRSDEESGRAVEKALSPATAAAESVHSPVQDTPPPKRTAQEGDSAEKALLPKRWTKGPARSPATQEWMKPQESSMTRSPAKEATNSRSRPSAAGRNPLVLSLEHFLQESTAQQSSHRWHRSGASSTEQAVAHPAKGSHEEVAQRTSVAASVVSVLPPYTPASDAAAAQAGTEGLCGAAVAEPQWDDLMWWPSAVPEASAVQESLGVASEWNTGRITPGQVVFVRCSGGELRRATVLRVVLGEEAMQADGMVEVLWGSVVEVLWNDEFAFAVVPVSDIVLDTSGFAVAASLSMWPEQTEKPICATAASSGSGVQDLENLQMLPAPSSSSSTAWQYPHELLHQQQVPQPIHSVPSAAALPAPCSLQDGTGTSNSRPIRRHSAVRARSSESSGVKDVSPARTKEEVAKRSSKQLPLAPLRIIKASSRSSSAEASPLARHHEPAELPAWCLVRRTFLEAPQATTEDVASPRASSAPPRVRWL